MTAPFTLSVTIPASLPVGVFSLPAGRGQKVDAGGPRSPDRLARLSINDQILVVNLVATDARR
jgi:hypothetical protein